ncbi:MAG TPA: mannosyltransferase family protein [Pyrinomonadaceae bacterium]|jgi:Gpi18-like mannosyltransferase
MKSSPDRGEGRAARLPAWLDARTVALVLAVKALVLLYGVQAFLVWKNERVGSLYNWLAIWNRWDAPHYLDIARAGYVSAGVEARWIVFFPLYPWLVRAASWAVRDELPAAFLVSGVASVAAALLLQRLARADGEPEEVARGAVFYMLVFPTAYFLHIGYNESLFLALALGAFLAARARCWWAAGLLGFLAALTRINGLLLLPALAFEAWEEYRGSGRRARAGWLWLLLVGAGFGVYLLINWWVLGDPRAFLKMQGEHWFKTPTWPWVGIQGAMNSARWLSPSDAQMVGWQEFSFIMLGFGLTALAWLRLRASYAVWMTCNWLLWTSTKFALSVPRYTLVLFPAFILLARLRAARPTWGAAVAVWSLLMLALFAARFSQGYWAF